MVFVYIKSSLRRPLSTVYAVQKLQAAVNCHFYSSVVSEWNNYTVWGESWTAEASHSPWQKKGEIKERRQKDTSVRGHIKR